MEWNAMEETRNGKWNLLSEKAGMDSVPFFVFVFDC